MNETHQEERRCETGANPGLEQKEKQGVIEEIVIEELAVDGICGIY